MLLLLIGKDSCGGDSGGPLIQRASLSSPWFQVGVTSFGTRRCGSGTPGKMLNQNANHTFRKDCLFEYLNQIDVLSFFF